MGLEFNKAPETTIEKLYRFAEIERLVELSGAEREPLLGSSVLIQEMVKVSDFDNSIRLAEARSSDTIIY
jgi:hypothetical protein